MRQSFLNCQLIFFCLVQNRKLFEFEQTQTEEMFAVVVVELPEGEERYRVNVKHGRRRLYKTVTSREVMMRTVCSSLAARLV